MSMLMDFSSDRRIVKIRQPYFPNSRGLAGWLLGASIILVSAPLFAQSGKLTAREIFYGSEPAAAAPAKAAVPAKAVQTSVRSPKATVANEAKATSAKAAEAAPSEPRSSDIKPVQAKTQAPVRSTPTTPDGSAVVPVALDRTPRKPLGIRLSLLRIAENGQAIEVAPDTSFRPGDRVRLNIAVSSSGYLYIINRGSSGTWTQLFPSPDLPNASNAVAPGITYSVPPDRNFVISDPAGEEKLFVILSRKPELDTRSLTLDMNRRDGSQKQNVASPDLPIPPRNAGNTNIAMVLPPMNDAMVDRLRTTYARDLIIEKVDDQTAGDRKEKAVYVVNPEGGDDSRVVLDALIQHH